MDRDGLGDFLRSRRERLRPEDVGLVPGPRRRTPGLRRDEVALLATMSTDYYERIEQGRGPQPSPSMLGAIARALRLTRDERDHVYLLAGHQPPPAHVALGYADPGLMTILDALAPSVPAMVTDDLEGVLAQNALGVALLGPLTGSGVRGEGEGGASFLWHWFTDERYRRLYAENDREVLSRGYVADLRAAVARRGSDAESTALVARLSAASAEFREIWALQEVRTKRVTRKVLDHERVGRLDLECDVVVSPPSGQHLVLFRPVPGTGTAERLALLAVVGTQELAPAE
ncbi:Helix-turn-helix domain-containing protein [Microlunatus sagamiharensis]|uniref:Helix-turn-helix domain-containing protein n=1 Tax=Microlunatus sagamiharensis TaxID=546874 RepID=A0A1H2NC06_9ACTN|nr:helix-turn-helix transcriptional regulator [Microlunatus sagamiharensis]SDV02987.1 Helix-turn-helix domain-containing protein [Microlunatus sagamiharensis]